MGLSILFGMFFFGLLVGMPVAYALKALLVATIVALPGLMTAVIIVGGFLSGVMTVTESGAFGAIRAFLVTLMVYRELTWPAFKQAVLTSVRTTALVMLLVATASAFSYLLALYRVPDLLAHPFGRSRRDRCLSRSGASRCGGSDIGR